jgi:hypothetical protein
MWQDEDTRKNHGKNHEDTMGIPVLLYGYILSF